jgi:EAL domain-containing protein (putative c-di-GMP-specific phosphodiesterase class I)
MGSVETLEQRACLADMGCDFIQAYLISKPAPAQQFAEVFARSREAAFALGVHSGPKQ